MATNFIFNGAGKVNLIYYAKLDSLPDHNAGGFPPEQCSNWLSENHYDAYLFGVLSEAHLYLHDEDRAAATYARSQAVLDKLRDDDRRHNTAGPLTVRLRNR